MFKTQLNCAPYIAPSDLKEIHHLVRAFLFLVFTSLSQNSVKSNFESFQKRERP